MVNMRRQQRRRKTLAICLSSRYCTRRMVTLYKGDNVFILPRYVADASVNLVYLDPPATRYPL